MGEICPLSFYGIQPNGRSMSLSLWLTFSKQEKNVSMGVYDKTENGRNMSTHLYLVYHLMEEICHFVHD